MHRRLLPVIGVLALIAPVALLSGCAPALEGGSGGVCAAASSADHLFGVRVTNVIDHDVMIEAIELDEVDGLELVDSWVMSLEHGGIGSMSWPVTDDHGMLWDERVPAVGATIEADAQVDLVLRLRLDEGRTSAIARAVRIVTDGGPTITASVIDVSLGFADDPVVDEQGNSRRAESDLCAPA